MAAGLAKVNVLRLLPLLALFSPSLSLKCFCTDNKCGGHFGVCEGDVCLVGIVKDSTQPYTPDNTTNPLQLIRFCGNLTFGCVRDEDRWSALCSCEEPYCNTFAYLHQIGMIPTQPPNESPPPTVAAIGGSAPGEKASSMPVKTEKNN